MRAHAVARLQERYAVREHALAIVSSLKARLLCGRAHFRFPLEDGRSEWEAYVGGRRIRFIWSEVDRKVITVLPPRRKRRREEPGC